MRFSLSSRTFELATKLVGRITNLAVGIPLSLALATGPSTSRAQTHAIGASVLASQSPALDSLFDIRGLGAGREGAVWATGTHGMYLWTTDGGTTRHFGQVPGATSLDFRDVQVVSSDVVYLMAAAQDTARIYKTTDRGAHWTMQYDDTRRGMFLDALAFFDDTHGLVLGDPVDGRFVILRTDDGGAHWTRIDSAGMPAALPGEAAFAASGTALVTGGAHDAWFATGGGPVSRVFRSHDSGRTWQVSETPVRAGNASAGIFSLSFSDATHGVAVGGNYAAPDTTQITVALTADGGVTWKAAAPSAATGYLSGVTIRPDSRGQSLVAVGTLGTAISRDGGRTWTQFDRLWANSVIATPGGTIWIAGPHTTLRTLSVP